MKIKNCTTPKADFSSGKTAQLQSAFIRYQESAETRQKSFSRSFFLAGLCLTAALQADNAFATAADIKTTDFAAAAPFTYSHATGGGAYNDRTVGAYNDITEQLQGGQFSCGDIVTYLSEVEIEPSTVEAIQDLRLSFAFLANSTGQAGAAHAEVVGVSINYGQVENGDDGTGTNPGAGFFGLDSGISDDGGSTATLVSSGLTGLLFDSGSELELTVDIDDLEAGESVVLRIDTRLACDSGSSPTGNLQGQLVSVIASDGAASGGAQTIPFLKIGELAGAGEPLLNITKTVTNTDGVCGVDDTETLDVTSGDVVKYCYVVNNPGTADLSDINFVDDNATPGDNSDDFNIALSGLADLDGENNEGDLAGGATATGNALVTISAAGTFTNTATVTGNNGRTGGNFATLTDSDTAEVSSVATPLPPIAGDDSFSTLVSEAVSFTVLNNDSDPDGNLDSTSVTVTNPPATGTLTDNGNGSFSYSNETAGIYSFDYEVCDTTGLCDTATVSITVNANEPANTAPIANMDSKTTPEETAITFNVATNDTDIDGNLDHTTANTDCESCTLPSHGTLLNNNDGTFTYTPNENYNGNDSFIYEICDELGLCATATVNIQVTPVNDPPVAEDDSATTQEDITVDIPVLANDSDLDNNLDFDSVTITAEPDNGTVIVNEDGSISYTPNENFVGVDTFSYQVCDTDELCDTAQVTVTVTSVNDAPIANDDNYSTAEDTALTVVAPGILGNDSDVDNDTLTATVLTGPANGTLTQQGDGSFTYEPDADYNGTDSYTYSACDPSGACAEATVTIEVIPANDAPDAVDDGATVDEDGSVAIPVLDNDSDADGDSLNITATSDPEHGSISIVDGVITYSPDQNFCGADSFTYTVSDGNGGTDTATVTVTVVCINDAPVANDDTATTDEDLPVNIPVLENDSDIDGDTLTVSEATDPANGSVTINSDGTIAYTPDPNFNGEDSFTYTACDEDGLCDTATVTVIIGGLNDKPVAVDDAYSTPEDTLLTITQPGILGNDSDVDGDTLAVQVLTEPEKGTLAQQSDGSFTYQPDENFYGIDSYTYQACDSEGLCDMATVTITVVAVNDVPVANDDSYTIPEDSTLTVSELGILVNDTDADGDVLTASVITGPNNGTLTQNPDGSFTYVPDADFNGTDSYTYNACDASGACDEATVTIIVEPVADAPIAVNDAYSTDEDTLLTVPAPGVLANDSDADGDALTVSLISGPANGTLTQNPDGSFSYLPDSNWNGNDSYTYEACDPSGLCASATVTIVVNPVNDAPLATDDRYLTAQNTTLGVVVDTGVLVNDSDVDGDALEVSDYESMSAFGGSVSLNADGSFSYTPATDFAGIDTFEYTVSDGQGGYDTAIVTIEVTAKNGRSISVSWDDWSLYAEELYGSFIVTNKSGGYDVQITEWAIQVQYRSSGPGKNEWIEVGVEGCNFDPAAPTLLADQMIVDFNSCILQAEIPTGSTVRVTALVDIYGHKDKGKQKVTFLSRSSKSI